MRDELCVSHVKHDGRAGMTTEPLEPVVLGAISGERGDLEVLTAGGFGHSADTWLNMKTQPWAR